jgi:hypothetical protein
MQLQTTISRSNITADAKSRALGSSNVAFDVVWLEAPIFEGGIAKASVCMKDALHATL